MKQIWICGLGILVATTLMKPASAQVSFYIGVTPPPMRVEPPPPPPPPGPPVVWVHGYWAPQGHHYRWVAGHYENPPYEGAYWSHPHYDHYPQGWEYHEGHWDHEDHGDHDDHDHDGRR